MTITEEHKNIINFLADYNTSQGNIVIKEDRSDIGKRHDITVINKNGFKTHWEIGITHDHKTLWADRKKNALIYDIIQYMKIYNIGDIKNKTIEDKDLRSLIKNIKHCKTRRSENWNIEYLQKKKHIKKSVYPYWIITVGK